MTPRIRIVVLVLLVAASAAGALLGGVLQGEGSAAAAGAGIPKGAAGAAAEAALTGFGATASNDLATLEQEARSRPRDVGALTLLGYAYLKRWRETADASFLPRAAEALRRAELLEPRNVDVVTGLGSLALSRHEFRRALALARRAQRLAPYSARPLGIAGDALLELGRYEEAFRTFDRMNALEPSVASYARVAYARELIGDLGGAVEAMQLAVGAAAGAPEPSAWALVELAKLDLQRGRLDVAARAARAARMLFPGYVYAEEQLARIDAARGRLQSAIARIRRAAEAVPLPQLVSLHADLLARAGRTRAAREQVRTIRAIDKLLAAGGIDTDLESVLLDADHRLRPATLVARARAARSARPSVFGDDALAWALARTGRCAEARSWSQRSLRLGTRDPLLAFHRAYVERCLGNADEARAWARRALAASPEFSVRWAPLARRFAA